MGGQHPLFWNSWGGNCSLEPRGCHHFTASCNTRDHSLAVEIIVLAVGLLMGLYWFYSENPPWKGTSCCSSNQVAAVVALGSTQHVARQELLVLQSPASKAEEKQ